VFGGLAVILIMLCLPVLGVWAWVRQWKRGISLYDGAGPFAAPFGENARYGFDAGLPVLLTIPGVGLAIVGVLAAPELMGSSWRWPHAMSGVIVPICSALMFGGWVLGLSLLFFLFPRVLAAPHLRDKRGWVPEWRFQMGQGRATRRARNGRRR
jgi:hypothetical protein